MKTTEMIAEEGVLQSFSSLAEDMTYGVHLSAFLGLELGGWAATEKLLFGGVIQRGPEMITEGMV